MDLHGKQVLVMGLGKTGEAVADFLLRRGAAVRISEKKTAEELGRKASFWEEKGVPVETGGHRIGSLLKADMIVPSPGVPLLPEIDEAAGRGISVISEIELAFHFLKGRIIGITGSNGKSTTATLTYKILKEGGRKAFLAGNIGTPLVSFVEDSREDDIYVTEISSFQLHHCRKFRASLAVFLNMSINHLDWHRTFDNYYAAKKKIVILQDADDIAVLNRDDPLVWALKKDAVSRIRAFSRKWKVTGGSYIKDGAFCFRNGREEKWMDVSEIRLPGAHNLDNVMASALAARHFGLPAGRIRESIRTFEGLEHRLEKVLTIKGVDFINDSKATTVDAALKALESFDRKIVLILGGRDKGDDFTRLRRATRKKVKEVILIGEARDKIRNALEGAVDIREAGNLAEACGLGLSAASPGDVVLFSPACASFDMFRNFEERGTTFKKEVLELAGRQGKGGV